MKNKILIILIVLVALGAGGLLVYKNFLGPKGVSELTPSPTPAVNKTTHGRIRQNEIWREKIRIVGDIIVEKGVTLTIEPGTKVLIAANQDVENLKTEPAIDFRWGINTGKDIDGVHTGEPYRDEKNHISILIFGTLNAVGTPDQMITITSDSSKPGIYDWNSLEFRNGILSYALVEYYRHFDPRDGTIVSNNILRKVGECAVCANSSVVVENNTISDAGHELVDVHNSSPTIRNNYLGPNINRSCITIDGGSPAITGNTIKGCGSGLSLLVPPKDPSLEDNILKNNKFLNNGQNVWYGY